MNFNIHDYISFELVGKCKLKEGIIKHFIYFKKVNKAKKHFLIIFEKSKKKEFSNNCKKKGKIFVINKGPASLRINYEEKTVYCSDNFPKCWLIKYMEDFLRILLLQDDSTFLHGSGVSKGNKGVVFVSWQGNGKTSILINLLKKRYDYLGDEKVIINSKKKVLSYPTLLHLESGTIRHYRKELKCNLFKKINLFLEPLFKKLIIYKNYTISEFLYYLYHRIFMIKMWIDPLRLFKTKIVQEIINPQLIFVEKRKNIRIPKISVMDSEKFIKKCRALGLYEWTTEILKIAAQYDFLFNPRKSLTAVIFESIENEKKILKSFNIKKLVIPFNYNFKDIDKLIE